ncbi:hypothetical protein E1A91_A03G229400v1 [Gossypium mustelinum]|uniref:Glycoside hydrolase family 19 catalytic domain-containing protein n=1 Tax=Gossypium mustelinum TaxID=34275 RepID=A0A5D3A1I5_GOSMU|nr:hypothetical protein E1A91_A03G229400v1 [Gossypium mustelinum]
MTTAIIEAFLPQCDCRIWQGDGECELQGYGVITNIINGGLECGQGGPDNRVEDRAHWVL